MSTATTATIVAVCVLVAVWAAYMAWRAHCDLTKADIDARSLRYELMRVCVAYEADKHRWIAAFARQRERRLKAMQDLARITATLGEMRELLAAYSVLAGNATLDRPAFGLSALRDDLDEFGKALGADDEQPT